jgi:hypothetical protein
MRCTDCKRDDQPRAFFRMTTRGPDGTLWSLCQHCAGQRAGDATRRKAGPNAKPGHRKRAAQ